MNNMQKKALPGYSDLALQVKQQGEAILELKKQVSRSNELLVSLNLYLGNPESEKGYLERLLEVAICSKKRDINHRSLGTKFTVIALSFAAIALIVEVTSKGGMPLFSIFWDFAKGVFL